MVKDLKLKNKNSLSYCGFVTIKACKGNKVVKTITQHNAGTEFLFKLLAAAICGSDVSNQMPKFLDIGNVDSNKLNFLSALTSRIGLTSRLLEKTIIDTTLYSWSAQFTAMIPSINIFSNTGNSATVNWLRLESNNTGNSTLAELDFTESELVLDTAAGYNYMIEWVMTFNNTENTTILSE